MKILIKKFQEGGPAPAAEEQVPAESADQGAAQNQEQNPIMQLAQMAMQAVQTGDCQAALQVCEAFIQLIQQSSAEGAPQEAPQGEPVYRQGGILVRRIKK